MSRHMRMLRAFRAGGARGTPDAEEIRVERDGETGAELREGALGLARKRSASMKTVTGSCIESFRHITADQMLANRVVVLLKQSVFHI